MKEEYILAFGTSNSSKSINKQFADFSGKAIENYEVKLVDLRDFELPLYGPDLEKEIGIPENAQTFSELIENAKGLIISLTEYNGSYTTVFKNIFDWMSRLDQKVWKNKPMLLLSTSPGRRGGMSVLNTSINLFPHFGGNIIAHFSLPSFHNNFSETGIIDKTLYAKFKTTVEIYTKYLNEN